MGIIKRFLALESYNASFHKDDSHLKRRELQHRRVIRTSVSAMLCAFSVAVLLLGTLTGVLDLCALAVCSAVTVFCILEMGGAYPYLVWAVTSVCSFLFLPNKAVAVEYLLFAGIYPVVKQKTAKMRPISAYAIRIAFFNVIAVVCALISRYVLMLPDDVGVPLGIPLLIFGNILFILYDFALISVTSVYLLRLRGVLHCDRL